MTSSVGQCSPEWGVPRVPGTLAAAVLVLYALKVWLKLIFKTTAFIVQFSGGGEVLDFTASSGAWPERGWSGGGGINIFQECHWVVGLFLLAKHITSSFTRVPCVYAQGIYNILNLSTCSASDSQVAQGAQTDTRSTIERSSGRRSIASSDRSRCSLRSRLGTRCIVPVAARQADWVCSQRVRC